MIPLEDFFRKPERTSPRLSPDGRRLAYLAPWERRLNLFVGELDSGVPARRVTDARARDLGGFAWAGNDHLLYVRDRGGDENDRLHSVRFDGEDARDLTPFDDVKCALVDDLEDDPEHVLFQMNRRDPRIFDVYRLHVPTGDFETAGRNPGNVQQWIPDADGRLRAAVTTDGVRESILWRPDETEAFRTVATFGFRESARPLRFDFDGRTLIASSNLGRDRRAVVRLEPESGRELEVLFEHDEVDVSQVLVSRRRRTLTGFVYETDRVRIEWIDRARRELQQRLEADHPGKEVTVVSMDRDERRVAYHVGSDVDRGGYAWRPVESRSETPLFRVAPWLDRRTLARMEPIRYDTRDGLTVHGYLTRPAGRAPYPMVVHPHGGPWHRDSWGFDPEVQFLANRGYAVLQMNFRGSTGYGREFWEASFGQWGLSMQDDVTDGTRWAIDRGIADPARIAIYGGSYGGYATLSGLVREPELYACGVSYVGVSNLFTWLAAFPPYWEPFLEMVHEMVGHPERDRERLEATSPALNADRIRAPLLVAQGANDPRVRKAESDQMVAALRDRGIAVDYLVKDDEGHGFRNEENVFEFYRALEGFLATHLGGRAERTY